MEYDYNNLTNSIAANAPNTIMAIGGLFKKQEQPIINMYQTPTPGNGMGMNSNTLMIAGAVIALVVFLVILKK